MSAPVGQLGEGEDWGTSGIGVCTWRLPWRRERLLSASDVRELKRFDFLTDTMGLPKELEVVSLGELGPLVDVETTAVWRMSTCPGEAERRGVREIATGSN